MAPLKISTEQMIALHGFFAEAAAVGEAGLAERSGSETLVEVAEVRCTHLADFADEGLALSDDLVAGVMGRLEGLMPGALALAMEPEDALVWAQSANGNEGPLEAFVGLASEFLGGLVASLGVVLDGACEFVGGRLIEEPELAMLVQTHAPSDTLVFSIRMRIETREEVLAAHAHWMIEPKYMAPLLSALSAAAH